MAADPAGMRAEPGEVLGLLSHGHPTLEGNGRTLMTVHAELCRRAGVRIAWEGVAKSDYMAALTGELERPGKVLDAFLAPHIQRSAASVAQDAKQLRSLLGLGPSAGPVALLKGKPRTMSTVLDAMRPPEPAAPPPWPPPPVSLTGRIRAFEERMNEGRARTPKAGEAPGPEQDEPPRPKQGPKP